MIQAGHDLIQRCEGLRLRRYLCPSGVPTIGYGATRWWDGGPIPEGAEITKEEAESLYRRDIVRFELRIQKLTRGCDVPPEAFASLVSFGYNAGLAALAGSTLLRKVRAEDWEGAAEEFGRWVFGGGRKLPGLVTRRAAERRLFLAGVTRQLNAAHTTPGIPPPSGASPLP